MPREHRLFVGERMLDLMETPLVLSRPSRFPYPESLRMYEFDLTPSPDEWHHFNILFRINEEKALIEVVGIGHINYEVP